MSSYKTLALPTLTTPTVPQPSPDHADLLRSKRLITRRYATWRALAISGWLVLLASAGVSTYRYANMHTELAAAKHHAHMLAVDNDWLQRKIDELERKQKTQQRITDHLRDRLRRRNLNPNEPPALPARVN